MECEYRNHAIVVRAVSIARNMKHTGVRMWWSRDRHPPGRTELASAALLKYSSEVLLQPLKWIKDACWAILQMIATQIEKQFHCAHLYSFSQAIFLHFDVLAFRKSARSRCSREADRRSRGC